MGTTTLRNDVGISIPTVGEMDGSPTLINKDVQRSIDERGHQLVAHVQEVPLKQANNIFFWNFSSTKESDLIALHAQLGVEIWIVDLGTNQHCYNNIELFFNL